MAMFADYVLNKETGRYEMQFVNQQYDLLMYIYFDEQTKTYKLNVSDEEADKISRSWWGRGFDLQYWLKEGEHRLR
ncbi:MAG: hypothetical protein HY015_06430 [Bacteroidetes bacterium]|nr:hypothetical protein [Bacteroidota bacterium]MBI3482600.1 hypothetical protein [Bacteroidota bacterium]